MDCQAADAPIVVIAPRLPEAPGEAAYSAFAIDEDTLADALRVDDALREAPGVSMFRRNDSGAANPTIQGLSVRAIAPSGAGRALVTLDGAPLNDPFGGWVIWGALPLRTIESATVLRGAGAGPYGAGALTGVVQLRERRGDGATLSVEGGERGHHSASGVGEAEDNAFSFMLAASTQQSDGWIPVRRGRGAADTALWSDSNAAVARLQWHGDGLVFSARVNGYSEQRSAGLVGANSTNEGAGLALTLARPDGDVAWRVQAWALSSDLANTSVSVAPDRNTTTPANDQTSTPALGWGGNAEIRWSGAHQGLELGVDLRTADGETRERFAYSGGAFMRSRVAGGRTLTAGAYAEAWREVGPWLFSGGARVDVYHAEDGRRIERLVATGVPTLDLSPPDSETTAPTARIGFRRDDGALFVRGAAYAGFRPPTLNELYRPFRVGNDVTEANAALDPERLTGADLGIGGDYRAWSWEASVFATRLDDPVVNVTLGAGQGTFPPGVFVPAGGAYRQRQNAGAINVAGVEAEARGALGAALSWRVALTYTHAETDDHLRPAQSPEWGATAGLAWRPYAATTFSADLSYESARFEDDLNSRTLAPATVLDLRAEQRLTETLAVYAALDNALDEAVETAETADGIESFGPPRTLRVGVRLRTP